ncbi:TniB family NTP-binding protein [Brevundimonas intermedia]|nr:TniB family NTP-binding protein [Brevundimonas intermedia]
MTSAPLEADVRSPVTGGVEERYSREANAVVAKMIGKFETIFIRYPPHIEFHGRCDYLQQLGRETKGLPQKGMRVLAPSGSGKTTAADAYIRMALTTRSPGGSAKPIVKVSLASATTVKKLFQSILDQFQDGFSDRGTEHGLRKRAMACFERFESELLIIDEVQHLNFRSTASNDVTDALKALLDMGVVPIVFLGTEDAQPMFERNLQLNGRLLPPCDFKPLFAANKGDMTLLGGYVEELDAEICRLGLMPEVGRLNTPWVLAALQQVSGGMVGRVSRLAQAALEIAIRRGATRLEPYDLAEAVDRWAIPQAFVEFNPFRVGLR